MTFIPTICVIYEIMWRRFPTVDAKSPGLTTGATPSLVRPTRKHPTCHPWGLYGAGFSLSIPTGRLIQFRIKAALPCRIILKELTIKAHRRPNS